MTKPPASLGWGGAVLAMLAGPVSAADSDFALERAAPGVYVHRGAQEESSAANRGDIANIGFIVGSRCVAVIDTGGSQAIGEALLAAIKARTAKPICYVINTHVHPDHCFGDGAFVTDGTVFVGNASFPAALDARRESYQRNLKLSLGDTAADSAIVPPTLLVENTMTLDLGDRTIQLQAWPTAHTDNDLTVFDLETRTLWTGDLLFVERIPVIDGKVLGWLKVLASLRALKPSHLVPGHGPVNRSLETAFGAEEKYLDELVSQTREAIKIGTTLPKAVETIGLDQQDSWLLFDNYHRRNVTAAYTELEWEE